MAIGETLVTVVGNICSDPLRRSVAEGHELLTFWLRSNERRFDKETGQWVDGRFLGVRVTCWRQLAGSVHESVGKGDPVIVTGRLRTNEYEADGQVRSVPELEALAVGPNLQWCTARIRRRSAAVRADTAQAPAHERAA
jgi:single-strand DNA-binding protein